MSDRRTELLDAARACFVAEGFRGTPVSAIVKSAGVAQGTFYLYFKSKADVVTALRREVVREYESALNRVGALELPVDERLARIIVAMSVIVRRNIDIERVFRTSGSGEDDLRAARDGRARLAAHAATLMASDAAILSEDPEMMAGFVVTLFDHILFEAHAFAPDTVDRVVRESLRFTLRGLGVASDRVDALLRRQAEFQADAEAL